ncbi:hypothetical protein C2E23DRAFT_365958 [Lenzites betulinus]|nr:hypothetical protein C2E23DRAFT_365958 [Lenzites betulinus]
MPPPQNQDQRGVKRKKPPTFQHLPIDRAKKLKQSWVEVQKIKSKWKAQKRKEGLVGSRPQLEQMLDAQEDPVDESDEDKDDAATSRSSSADSASEDDEDGESEEESADEHPTPSSSKPPAVPARQLNHQQRRRAKKEQPEAELSLRELQNKAYSKASLHTHKSHPLNRHKAPAVSRGRGGRGGGRGSSSRGAPRGQGRGQPDMGLRMKAMLEKIKHGLS